MNRGLMLLVSLAVTLSVACTRNPDVAKGEYLASGNAFLAQNKVKEAILQYRNALRKDPRFGEARHKLAEAYERDGDFAKAGHEYIRAADLLPADVQVQLKAGEYLLLSGRFEDAKTRATRALELDPRNVDAQILRGNALVGLKDLEGALGEIQEAIRLDPANTDGYISLGAMQQTAGRSAEAEAAFRKAVEANPSSISTHLALANFYWKMRKGSETANALQQAYRLDPDHRVVNQMLGLFHIMIGKSASAEPYFKKVADVSQDPKAKLVLADYYIATRRPKDALPLLEQLTTDKALQSVAELRLGELDLLQGRPERGRLRVDAVLAREPHSVPGLILKARFLSTAGRLDEAIEQLKAAVAASPASAEAHFALGRAYVTKDDRAEAIKAFNETLRLNPRAVAAHLALSKLELAGGSPDSAIQSAEQALQNAPRSPEAQLALLRGLVARQQLGRAEPVLLQLMKQYPNDPGVLTQAGTVALLKGDRERARRLFVNAVGVRESNVEALTALISLDLLEKKPADAIARAEAFVAKAPNHPGALMLAARTYAAAGDPKKAELALRKTIEVDSGNLQAYHRLVRLYVSQKRLGEALKELDLLVQRQPRPVQAHTLAAMILETQGNIPEARKRYEQALAIDPETPVAANNLAWIYAETGGNLDVALQLAQTATRGLPDHPGVQDTLGWIYYKKGLGRLAIGPFQQSVAKDPKNPIYHFHLGLAQAMVGDSGNAKLALQQALTLAPDFEGAAAARQALASLKI